METYEEQLIGFDSGLIDSVRELQSRVVRVTMLLRRRNEGQLSLLASSIASDIAQIETGLLKGASGDQRES